MEVQPLIGWLHAVSIPTLTFAISVFALWIAVSWATTLCSSLPGTAYYDSYGLFPVVSLSSELLNQESENVFEVE